MTSRARLYERLPVLDSDRWWLELAAGSPDGRVLELGAGIGRLTAALAAAGSRVTAVEQDPEMLAGLRRRAVADVDVVDADVTDLPDLGRFGLVVLPTSLLNELEDTAARRAVLAGAARCCRPDGQVALHLLGPWWLARLPEDALGELTPVGDGPPVEVRIRAAELDAFRSRRRARLTYRFADGEVLEDRLDAAIVTPEEMLDGLAAAGLTLVGRYGAEPPGRLLPGDAAWHLLARRR